MKIGLTGGIGCGKSSALKIFEEKGWHTLSTDAIAHKLMAKDPEVKAGLLEGFGTIENKAIASKVFSNPEKKHFLENLLHPRIRKYWTEQIQAQPDEKWVVEIPLLFEKRLENYFNLIVCVACSSETQLERLRLRGIEVDDAKARIANQAPLSLKIEQSDRVLSNNGTLDFLEEQIDQLLQHL